jgi:hypothetical protein
LKTNQFLTLALTGLSIVALNSCKKKSKSETKAIVSKDGKNAIGLLPMRQYYFNMAPIGQDSAMAVEDALRLTYVAAKCTGDDSAALFNTLEDISRYSTTAMRHIGRSIVIDPVSVMLASTSTDQSNRFNKVVNEHFSIKNGTYSVDSNCSIIGSSALSGASFAAIMTDPNGSFEAKQIIWLAVRGRYTASQFFAPAFYTFLRENLGASPINPNGSSATITKIDAQFNPCVNKDSLATKIFTCDGNGNYEVKDNFEKELQKLTDTVKAANDGYLAALSQGDANAQLSAKGLKQAVSLDTTIENANLIQEPAQNPGSAPAPSKNFSSSINPAIAVMINKLPLLQTYFDVHVGTTLGQVIDPSNPKVLDVSLAASKTKSAKSALALGDSSSAGSSTSGSSSKTNASTTTPPADAKPIVKAQVTPANIKVDDGDKDFWQRGTGDNVNHFQSKADTDGNYYVAKAVKRDNVWVYDKIKMDKNNQPIPETQRILFHGANNLAGGSGENTFVSYKVDDQSKHDINNINVQDYTNKEGALYTKDQNGSGQWVDFKQMTQEHAQSIKSTPISFGDTRMKTIVPYTFTPQGAPPESKPRLLGQTEYNNWNWVDLPDAEKPAPAKDYDLFADSNRASPEGPASEYQRHDTAQNPSQGNQTARPRTPDPEKIAQLNLLKQKEAADEVIQDQQSAEKQRLKNSPNKPLENKTNSELDLLKQKYTQLSEYLKTHPVPDGTSPNGEMKKIQDDIEVQKLAVIKAKQTEFGVSNAPGSDQRFSGPDKAMLTELDKQKQEQERLIEERRKQSSNELSIIQQEIKVKEHELQIAKIAREKFSNDNGPRYGTRQRYKGQGFAPSGPRGTFDNYTPDQLNRMNNLHGDVRRKELAIDNLKKKLLSIQGDPSAFAINAQTN